jgi:hypothetical protein
MEMDVSATLAHDRVSVVTSMNAAGWQEYGQRFVSSFAELWPSSVTLEVYAEGFDPELVDARVVARDFQERCGVQDAAFRSMYGEILRRLGAKSMENYRLQADKFSKKAFVIADALREHDGGFVIWLDADSYTHTRVSLPMLRQLIRAEDEAVFCAYLRRFGVHTESGFLSFNASHALCRSFVEQYEGQYLSGAVFHLEGWTDCHVFDWVRALHVAQGYRSAYFEIPSRGNRHVFLNSPVGLLMDHLKGDRKELGQSTAADFVLPPRSRVSFDGRYGQLNQLIRLFRPSTFIEVGTWSGWRAVSMALEASLYAESVNYRGYDVFEAGTQELDAKEKNVKPHFSESSIRKLLDYCRFLVPGFAYELISGDTNVTLREGDRADFAFIDGGHAIATIDNDYWSLSDSGVIVLDDYYEGPIDTSQFGCNQVIKDVPHRVLPVADPVSGGGEVKFAVVSSEKNLQFIDQELLGRA